MMYIYLYYRCNSSSFDDDISNKENNCDNVKKRKLYPHKFNTNWTEQFSWLKKYKENAFCNVCDLKLIGSITHIKRHEQTNKHKTNYQIYKQHHKMEDFVKDDKTILNDRKVYSAELKLIMFLHEHNLPFLLMDHLPKLISSICPDSDIAKSINCGRTKATIITNECLAVEQLKLLQKLLSDEKCYYSIIIDETTDVSIKKCLAVVIRFVHKNKVRDKFLGLIEVESASAEALFNTVIELLTK